jgi:hypothetical protein
MLHELLWLHVDRTNGCTYEVDSNSITEVTSSAEDGIQGDSSRGHSENALEEMTLSFEFAANSRQPSDLHCPKHSLLITSTDDGI